MPTHFFGPQHVLAASFLSAVGILAVALIMYRAHSNESPSALAVIHPGPPWKKSSKSAQGNCVEVAALPDAVLVRDSKNPVDGQALAFPKASWADFIGSVKSGEIEVSRISH